MAVKKCNVTYKISIIFSEESLECRRMSDLEFHPSVISWDEVSVPVFHIVQGMVEHLSLAETVCDARKNILDERI